MANKKFFAIVVACMFVVIMVAFVLPVFLINKCGFDFQNYGVYGDLFGCFNSLMSALAFGGLIYTIILMKDQLNQSISIKKADYLNDFVEKISFDSDVVQFVNWIDYKKVNWYNENFHNGSENEKIADKALLYLSYVLYLKKEKAIGEGEFHFFKYYLKRVLLDRQVQNYLYNLYHFDKNEFLFKNLTDYADEQKWLRSKFYDENAWKENVFPKYLNF